MEGMHGSLDLHAFIFEKQRGRVIIYNCVWQEGIVLSVYVLPGKTLGN